MPNRTQSVAALAGAPSLGTAKVPVGIAGAAVRPLPSSTATARSAASADAGVARADLAAHVTDTVRSVSDGAFRMTRTISHADGSYRIIFTATDLRTGRTCALTGGG
jgi:hypothetical protein